MHGELEDAPRRDRRGSASSPSLLDEPRDRLAGEGGRPRARSPQGADELVVNFVRLLVEKGRAARDRARSPTSSTRSSRPSERVLDVELTTAHELSDDEFERILAQIEKASGRKVQATRNVDPDLIGGIVLQAGSMRLDASVRGRLERLRHDLTHARS